MQDRKNYASGNTLTTEGFRCSIGEPIDIIVDDGTSFGYNANINIDKQMLVTLEVDGETVCYRELHDFEVVNDDEYAIVVGDYTINIDADELTGEYTSARIRLEPVELIVTDAFRAAVSKVAPSGGGGVLVVHCVNNVLDKTWQEIDDAFVSGGVIVELNDERSVFQNAVIGVESSNRSHSVTVAAQGNWNPGTFIATDGADGYPRQGG